MARGCKSSLPPNQRPRPNQDGRSAVPLRIPPTRPTDHPPRQPLEALPPATNGALVIRRLVAGRLPTRTTALIHDTRRPSALDVEPALVVASPARHSAHPRIKDAIVAPVVGQSRWDRQDRWRPPHTPARPRMPTPAHTVEAGPVPAIGASANPRDRLEFQRHALPTSFVNDSGSWFCSSQPQTAQVRAAPG